MVVFPSHLYSEARFDLFTPAYPTRWLCGRLLLLPHDLENKTPNGPGVCKDSEVHQDLDPVSDC